MMGDNAIRKERDFFVRSLFVVFPRTMMGSTVMMVNDGRDAGIVML